jgi:hypothetical protein
VSISCIIVNRQCTQKFTQIADSSSLTITSRHRESID